MEQLEHNWDRQREQLSALLDNELAGQERATLEAHLGACADCRAELESLRRARALLRALPRPALPRSFALPVEAAPTRERANRPAAAAPAASGAPRRPASLPPTSIASRRRPARALQWFSTIAAVLGIILLLSSAFSGISFRGVTNSASFGTSNQPVSGAAQPANTRVPSSTHSTVGTEPGLGTPAPTTQETPSATPESNGSQAHNPEEPPGPSGFSFASFFTATGLGFLLLVLSGCGYILAWALRRR